MNSREKILSSLKSHQLPDPGLPELSVLRKHALSVDEKKNLFTERLRVAGADTLEGGLAGVEDWKKNCDPLLKSWASIVPGQETPLSSEQKNSPSYWASLKLLILEAEFGVAENGAVWINAQNLPHRSSFLLPECLLVYLNPNQIVDTLHDAYPKIDFKNLTYGFFLAGPSKTADIEQSLVIGAQGAKSLRVVWSEA